MKHIEIGSLVSHYRIERQIGVGGMGTVFLAQDLTLDRPVAIKFLSVQDDERSRRRLLREAQAAAALEHECIAAVYEVGTDPIGGDFIAMQYIEGETLAARLRRGRLPEAEALVIAGRVTEALVAAHRRGVIHRDLKPHNIIITATGLPKLLDFGLATRSSAALPPDAATETGTSVTATHSAVGTPSYMAPEQVRNQTTDARSDVFALGCVVYECLTGRRAFDGATSAEIFGQVLHVEPPPVSSIVPELGPAYDAFCARMLKKPVAERFQSAEEVLGAIHALQDTVKLVSSHSGAYASQRSMTTRAWTGLSPRSKWAALATAVLIIAGSVSAWRWYRGDVLPDPPADAARYYAMGVEALRDGTYAGARDRFNEAIESFRSYVQAYSGLAKAYKELDDENAAQQALLYVNQLVPNRTRLPTDERLRLEAVLASVARTHDAAINAYRELAERHPQDPGAWLDLGLAEEQALRLKDARVHFEKALALDRRWPAAHVRLAILQIQTGETTQALASLDEAIRLYRVAGKIEGEAEALLRKGIAHNDAGSFREARQTLEQVIKLAGDQYVAQRLKARFELARVAVQEGRPDELVAATEEATRETAGAGLHTIAANGLVDFANLLLGSDPVRADAELARAKQLAADHGAKRTEMRAQLQRAFLLIDTKPEEAIALAAVPLKFFSENHYPMLEADAKNIMSRAREAVGDLTEAVRLASEALDFADTIPDAALANTALQNLGPQFEKLGRLPEAATAYQRSADFYRKKAAVPYLAFTLLRQAELLIVLGRGAEAEAALAEVEDGIASKADTNAGRPRRVARLRALRAVTEGRYDDVARYATAAAVKPGESPDSTANSASAYAEYARAKLGRSRTPPEALVKWLDGITSATQKPELSYWVAQTLRARGQDAMAGDVARAAWEGLAGQPNPELRWRLAAITNLSAPTQIGVTMPPRSAEEDVQKLKALWPGYDSTAYFSRADLKPLLGNASQ